MLPIKDQIYNYLQNTNIYIVNEWKKFTQEHKIAALSLVIFSLYICVTCIYKLHKFYQSAKFYPHHRLQKIQDIALNNLNSPNLKPQQTDLERIQLLKPIEQPSIEIVETGQPDPNKGAIALKINLLNNLISALTLIGNQENLKQAEELSKLKNNPDNIDISPENVLAILHLSPQYEVEKEIRHNELYNIKEVFLFALMVKKTPWQEYGINLYRKTASETVREDRLFALQAMLLNHGILEYLNNEFRDDAEIIKTPFCKIEDNLVFASKEIKNNKLFLLDVLSKIKISSGFTSNDFAWQGRFSKSFLQDEEFMLAVFKNRPGEIKYHKQNPLLYREEFVLKALANAGKNAHIIFRHLPKEFKSLKLLLASIHTNSNPRDYNYSEDEREALIRLIEINPLFLKFASVTLNNDPEVVLRAINKDGRALEWASMNLKNNKTIALAAIKNHPLALAYVSEKLKEECVEDPDFKEAIKISRDKIQMLKFIKEDFYNFDCAANSLKMDPDLLLALIKQNNKSIDKVPIQLFKDKNFVSELSKIISSKNICRSNVYQNHCVKDREIISNLIQVYPTIALNFFRDKQLILQGLQLDPSIMYGILGFISDPDIALATLKVNRSMIHELHHLLLKEKNFILKVMVINKLVYYYLPDELKKDPEIITAFQAA